MARFEGAAQFTQLMHTAPENPQDPASASSILTQGRLAHLLADPVRWTPAILLLLYVMGYVTANSHYAHFEVVGPTLLTGRYLSAGLLYAAYALAPMALGFACIMHIASWRKAGGKGLKTALFAPSYLGVLYLYGSPLITYSAIRSSEWVPWAFIGGAAIVGAIAGSGLLQVEERGDRRFRALAYVGQLVTPGLLMLGLATTLGLHVYPSIRPQFGGGAVLEGYVSLKPGAPPELMGILDGQPVPIVDRDERFLYVVACERQEGEARPEVVMVPLELVLAAGVRAYPDSFVSVPAYIKEHKPCSP